MALNVRQVERLTLHTGSIYNLTKGEDDSSFFSGGSEGVVVHWNLRSLNKPVAVAKVDGQIFSLLYLKEQNHLLLGTMSGGIHVIDLNARKEIHYITFHEQSIFDLKENKSRIFACSKDGTVSVWNATSFQLEKVIAVSDQSLRMIAFHPEKEEAAIGSSDNKIYLIDTLGHFVKANFEGPDNSVFSVCYNHGGKDLIAGSRDAQLYIYSTEEKRLKSQIKAHLFTINDLAAIHGSKFLATASRDKTIRIWDAENFDLQKSLDREKYNGHKNSVNKLLWIAAENYLISGSDDRSLIIWEVSE